MLDSLGSAMADCASPYSLHPHRNRSVTHMSLSSFELILNNEAAKSMYIYNYFDDFVSLQATASTDTFAKWPILYASFALSTTILCTILIIYRIINVVIRTEQGRAGIQSYRGAIEILVESASLYSLTLLIYIIFFACGTLVSEYIDDVSMVIRVCLFLTSELKS